LTELLLIFLKVLGKKAFQLGFEVAIRSSDRSSARGWEKCKQSVLEPELVAERNELALFLFVDPERGHCDER
jgi:hypothetical protein